MKGSEPPISSTTFFRLRPATSATAEPARSDPVTETPRTRGSGITFSAICVQLGDAPDLRGALGDRERGEGRRCVPGLGDRGAKLAIGDLRVLLDQLAGRRVNDCVRAHLAPLLRCFQFLIVQLMRAG